MGFSAFDYLLGKDKTIYVVHGFSERYNSILVRPVYRKGNKLNYGEVIDIARKRRSRHWSEFFDETELLCQLNDFIYQYPRSTKRIINQKKNKDNELVNELIKLGSKIYKFGSRTLGVNRADSDRDYLIECNKNPREQIIKGMSRTRSVLFQNRKEIIRRTEKYLDNRYINNQLLKKLRKASSLYLTDKEDRKIEFFSVHKNDTRIPNLFKKDNYYAHVSGKIIPSHGSSYVMPRKIHMAVDNKKILLSTSAWVLAGLEELSGEYVHLENILKYGCYHYWFSPGISKISIDI